nr:sensor domain-containing phosphodiesterase [Halobacillus locisalis]
MKDARLTSIDLLPAFEMICESAVETLQVDRVSIWFYNHEQTSLICESLYDSTLQSFQDAEALHEEYYPDYFSALEKNRSIVVNDTHSDDRVRELSDHYLSKLNIRAMMDIPIISGGMTLGVLCCEQYGDSREWSFDEEAYATSIGDMVAFINEHVKRRDAEQEAKKLAYYDALTDLPNRNLLEEKLDEKIEESSGHFAFFYLDIDDFSKVNEQLGFRIGDQLLMAIAKRLKSKRSSEDVIGRIDHDGFVVLTGFSDEKSHLFRSIHHYQQLFQQPFLIEGHNIFITVSTGVVLYPEGGDNPGTIMRNAHRANAVAKHEGLSSTKFYEHSYDDYAFEDQWFHMNLKQALEHNEFCMYYQPQVNIETMEVTGLEALIRWNHPSKGQISPQKFIPFAEVTGLIVPLGDWILRQAVEQILVLEHNGYDDVRISVNISPEQFKHPAFIDTLTAILSERSVSPSKLRLEITETMAIDHESAVIARLHKLDEMGVTVALDDFGTGYSSLKYLSLFPIHCLKIDRSFIDDITSNVKNEAIVRSIIDLADNLQLEVVAEGVESKEVLHHLQQLGNQTIQGYYFSKPMPTDQLLPWMESFAKS